MTTTLPPAVEDLFARLAADDDIRALAASAAVPTTRGDYVHYMHVLPMLAEGSPLCSDTTANLRAWSTILERAGGNVQGIRDALRILGAS